MVQPLSNNFGKSLESEPKFRGTLECPVQVDEAKVDGAAKYKKGRRLAGDAPEQDEDDLELGDWAVPDDDDEGDVDDSEHVRFGEDVDGWKWVVGIYNGPGRVRFLRVPNRTSRTLTAIIAHYCEPGSVVHTDGWRGYNALEDNGFVREVVLHKENYVDPISGAHTLGIERAWVEVKAWWRRSPGNSQMLQAHLDGIAWRCLHREHKNTPDMYDRFLDAVRSVHVCP